MNVPEGLAVGFLCLPQLGWQGAQEELTEGWGLSPHPSLPCLALYMWGACVCDTHTHYLQFTLLQPCDYIQGFPLYCLLKCWHFVLFCFACSILYEFVETKLSPRDPENSSCVSLLWAKACVCPVPDSHSQAAWSEAEGTHGVHRAPGGDMARKAACPMGRKTRQCGHYSLQVEQT